MFENEKTKNYGVHYSRYIMSWYRSGGEPYRDEFKNWLISLDHLTDDEIDDILQMFDNGKMELESSATRFLAENEKILL